MSPGDFLALREVSVTYDIPSRFVESFGVSRATVTLAGRNPHKWSRYSGIDPEVGRSFYGLQHDWLNYALVPQLAQVVSTVRVTF
jgi:hypothetical protein